MNPGEVHETLVDQLYDLLRFAADLDADWRLDDRLALAVAVRGEAAS